MNPKTLLSLAIALMVIAGGASAAVAGADGDLEVVVAQNDATGEATVEVTQNDTLVENASVNVTVDDENVTYDGTGDYETDEDGAVQLPAPDEEVNVTITADYEDETATVSTTLEAAPGFQVNVDQNPGEDAIVTVTDNGTAVENASVNVTVDDENVTYDGAGDHETDEDGTVTLSAPDEDVNVTITADYENETTTVSTTLEAAPGFQVNVDQDPGEDAIVTVTDNGTAVENASVNVTVVDENITYDGAGDYETDEDGTVVLPVPNETVTVEVTATHDDRTASTTATLQAHEIDPTLPFGQQLQQYMDTIEDDEHPFGHHVANWVTKNNPGNAPAHAGPPEHAGPPDHAGPGGDAGNETDREPGPPDHAGPGSDGGETNETDREPGPPDHAGGPHADDEDAEDDGDE